MKNIDFRHTSSRISRALQHSLRTSSFCTSMYIIGFVTIIILFYCTGASQMWMGSWFNGIKNRNDGNGQVNTPHNSQDSGNGQLNTPRDVSDLRVSHPDPSRNGVENIASNSNTTKTALEIPVYPEKELADMVKEIRSSEIYMRSPSDTARLGYKGEDVEKDYSQHEQGTFVDKALGQMENGFFVECGASNGVTGSNTLMLERKRKWTGLLVEANADFYKRLLKADRNAYSANVCLSPTTHSEVLTFRPAEYFGGLVETMKENQLELVKTRSGGQDDKQVSTQCFPLYALLCALNRTKVDYFSLDIEGAELDILRTIPFDKIRIEVFTVEYRIPAHNSGKTDAEGSVANLHKIRDFFKALGQYEEIGILPPGGARNEAAGLDVIFKHM